MRALTADRKRTKRATGRGRRVPLTPESVSDPETVSGKRSEDVGSALTAPVETDDDAAVEINADGIVENRPINIRKALAGLYLLRGDGSLKRCLMQAGFSEKTASNPTQAKLTGQNLLAETARLENESKPGKLLAAARARMAEALAVADPLRTPLKDIARAFETVEKLHGARESSIPLVPGLDVGERLVMVERLVLVARERGLPIGRKSLLSKAKAATIDAETVKSSEIPPMSDNRPYDNLEEMAGF